MNRRQLLQWSATVAAAGVVGACSHRGTAGRTAARPATRTMPAPTRLDAAAFHASRRFAQLGPRRIAYVERGTGDAAVFLHGVPLNGFQWRGALDRLAADRRCIALDFMGLGYSEVPEDQPLAAGDQLAMLVDLLDALAIDRADVVASDSGGAVAQLLVAHHPERVRTLLLTNCDVEPDSPPAKVMPVIEMARAGTLADATAAWLTDPALARSTFGAAVYRDPAGLTDETIAYYVTPLVGSPVRRAQYHAFHVALLPNPLAGVEAALRRSQVPVRIVWGAADDIFAPADADYLDGVFPASRGVRRVPGGKLFFPEEFPDVIAEEARQLWGISHTAPARTRI
jgi:pimeloyl-ACP methyl ester carboxylesterase